MPPGLELKPSKMPALFHLCYITDRHGLGSNPLAWHLQAAIEAGVDLIQLREKDLACRELLSLAKVAVDFSRGSKTWIVVNDRLDIALAAGAHGVHLGGQSAPPKAVRRHVDKDFLVGVSCHSLDEALRAEAGRADYVLLGPIFDTPSKRPYGPPLGLDKLSEVTNRIRIPVLALGGVTVGRVKPCLEAGAIGIAGIRLFQVGPHIADRVRELREQFL
ncbi:MAG: thiamine phosphate synthase [Acidobacteria bacterium]|nr:MAG: thiamine phosphate synthase [Acidobacteriota bacterium]